MKTASIICLIAAILGIAFAFWASNGIAFAENQIHQGLDRAEAAIAGKNWNEVAAGVDAVHWGDKNLYVARVFEFLGLLAASILAGLSLVLSVVESRRSSNKQ